MSLKLKNYFLILLSLSIFLFSCSGGDDDSPNGNDVNPNDNSLKSFSFTQSDNASLSQNCASVQNGNLFYITVPDGADLTKLVPSFIVAEGATVSINNKTIENHKTAADFSQTTKLVVTSQSGMARTYLILANLNI